MKTDIYFKRYIKNDPLQCKEIDFHSDSKHWILNGGYHREDGPARTWDDGDKSWWLENEFYALEHQYWEAVKKYKTSIKK